MKRFLLIILAAILLNGCNQENLVPEVKINSGEGLVLKFEHEPYEEISITTRATLPTSVENRVSNLYVFIFQTDGECVYSQFYDTSDRVTSSESFYSDVNNLCWFFEIDPNTNLSSGVIKLNSTDIGSSTINGDLYIIANIDNELTSLSVSRLSAVNTKSELMNVVNYFLEPTITRTGNFVLVGSGKIVIEDGSIQRLYNQKLGNTSTLSPIKLERVDAKIDFKFGIVPGATVMVQEMVSGVMQTHYQEIISFTPESWQVMNLPNGCYVIGRDEDVPEEDMNGYYNSPEYSFETITSNVPCKGYAFEDLSNSYLSDGFDRTEYGFSFYMFENREEKKKSVNSSTYTGVSKYHLRDKRVRNGDGTLPDSGPMWEFAPEKGTYVILKGLVQLRHLSPELQVLEQTTTADVTYYIHLGNFGSSTNTADEDKYDNYSIERNSVYNYTINIKGISSIVAEAEKDSEDGYNRLNEKQSGSKGRIFTSPPNNDYIFDAHFGQRVFVLDYADFEIFPDAERSLTWGVVSPFGRAGMPDRVGEEQVEVPNGLDYKWVHFLVKNLEDENNPNNVPWPGANSTRLMDILQFSNYMREQIRRKKANEPNDFGTDGLIYVQVYVDEYFYEEDPITKEHRPYLWREFVNQPMRELAIVCSAVSSADKQIDYTKGVLKIRQRSIQTIYNTNVATEGWGVEVTDEYAHKLNFYNRSKSLDKDKENAIPVEGNDFYNGLYNSGRLWGLVTGGSNQVVKGSFVNNLLWSDFVNYHHVDIGSEHTNFLANSDTKNTMRYACLARNRDENGDGIIDQNEIKWYMASLDQLRYLYVADQGLMGEAQLYYVTDPGSPGALDIIIDGITFNRFRSHVLSSTVGNIDNRGYQPLFVWAEQGCSYSDYLKDIDWGQPARYTMRCARNLIPDNGTKDITDPADAPAQLITMTQDPDTKYYTFDLSLVNEKSLRPKVTGVMLPTDQNSMMARPYRKFSTGDFVEQSALSRYDNAGYLELRQMLLNSYSPCPNGYRTPNVREMAIAFLMIPIGNASNQFNYFWPAGNKGLMCCNYYSFGNSEVGGNELDIKAVNDSNNGYSIFFIKGQNNITTYSGNMDASSLSHGLIRCVKDED